MFIKKYSLIVALLVVFSAITLIDAQQSERLTRAYQVRSETSELRKMRAEAVAELRQLRKINGRDLLNLRGFEPVSEFFTAEKAKATALAEEIRALTQLIING